MDMISAGCQEAPWSGFSAASCGGSEGRESPGWGRWLAGPRAPAAASIKEEDAGQGVGRRKRKARRILQSFFTEFTLPSNNSMANVKWSQDVSDGR
jgi:hypothetical protein